MMIDPKADPALASALEAMIARGEAFRDECRRRGVKFLPLQVMRPIYKDGGLSVGPTVKSRSADFFALNFQTHKA